MRVSRKASGFVVPAAIIAGLCMSVGPRSAQASELSKAPAETETNIGGTFAIGPRVDWRFFNWRELGPNNGKQLSESGSLFAVGIDSRVALGPAKQFFVEAGGNFYLGKVNYDGFLGDVPYKSKTRYFGLELLPTAGYVFSLGQHLRLTPTAGVGFEYWHRNLDDGGSFGYDEKYSVYLIHAGLRGTYALNRDLAFHSSVGLKMPVSISESVDLASRGHLGPADIKLSPGISPAILIEGGSAIHGLDVAVYFETWTLTKSNVDRGFFQPESTRRIFGVRLSHSFTLN